MAYEKQIWEDRVVQNPMTYNMQTNDDGTITLIPAPGTVTKEGNLITAERMNHMEDGIAQINDIKGFIKIDDIIIINGKTEPLSESDVICQAVADYPTGLNKNNCVVLSIMFQGFSNLKSWCTGSSFDTSNILSGSVPSVVKLTNDNILISFKNILLTNNGVTIPTTEEYSTATRLDYKLVLMKLPELQEGVDYILGDVNGDGQITEDDLKLMQKYLQENISFTNKQLKAADVNRDDEVNTGDTFKMQQYLNGVIDHF